MTELNIPARLPLNEAMRLVGLSGGSSNGGGGALTTLDGPQSSFKDDLAGGAADRGRCGCKY